MERILTMANLKLKLIYTHPSGQSTNQLENYKNGPVFFFVFF